MAFPSALKRVLLVVSPPIALAAARAAKGGLLRVAGRAPAQEWEYIGPEWTDEIEQSVRGWDVPTVQSAYDAKWELFLKSLRGTGPLGTTPESASDAEPDMMSHNIMMSYAYALAYSTRTKTAFSMLDWGGGMGHYYHISRALLPAVDIEYHCKDVPVLAKRGQELLPGGHFYWDETCLQRQYDFVLVSTSLHYSRDWKRVLKALVGATAGYILVTQLPVVQDAPSFVYVQRAQKYGYGTEYISWCLNRDEFLKAAAGANAQLVREFIIGNRPPIFGAPEQCEYRGYLFRVGDDAA